jgi:hypothetical protein
MSILALRLVSILLLASGVDPPLAPGVDPPLAPGVDLLEPPDHVSGVAVDLGMEGFVATLCCPVQVKGNHDVSVSNWFDSSVWQAMV